MKKLVGIIFIFSLNFSAIAQDAYSDSISKRVHNLIGSGETASAIQAINKNIADGNDNIKMQQLLVYAYHYSKAYKEAGEVANKMIKRRDVDEYSFYVAANFFSQTEDNASAEKIFQKGLRKFPKSGMLYNFYGEYYDKSFNKKSIECWEKGISVEPNYPYNYYNATKFYSANKNNVEKILFYAEIYLNMDSYSAKTEEIKQLLFNCYKTNVFNQSNLVESMFNSQNQFTNTFLETLKNAVEKMDYKFSIENLIAARSQFLQLWKSQSKEYPYELFDYLNNLERLKIFTAYNYWLFAVPELKDNYNNWLKASGEEQKNFLYYQGNHIFKFRQTPNIYFEGKSKNIMGVF